MSNPQAATPAASEFPPVSRREIFGWCCFDFANSAYTTIIITVVYAVYFRGVVAAGDPRAEGWWGTALGLAQLTVLFAAPAVGAMADVTARKKRLLMVTATACSLATAALALAGPGAVWPALGLVFTATVAFALGEVLCAAFLPELSTPATAGRISGYGWSCGYLGGLLSLVLARLIIGDDGAERVRWTFVMTGAFFLTAALPTFLLLRERARPRPRAAGETFAAVALRQLADLRQNLPRHRTLAVFFAALTLFQSGLTAVVAFAALFATQVVGMTPAETLNLFIVLQLAGVAGAFGFGFWQDRAGPKPPLAAALVLWVAVCAWAALSRTKEEFFVIGMLAGLAMGATQSSARAVVSMLTPEGRQGEFFGYWGVFTRLAAVIGPAVFGWLVTLAGYRAAIAADAVFFLAGLLVLLPLRLRAAR